MGSKGSERKATRKPGRRQSAKGRGSRRRPYRWPCGWAILVNKEHTNWPRIIETKIIIIIGQDVCCLKGMEIRGEEFAPAKRVKN